MKPHSNISFKPVPPPRNMRSASDSSKEPNKQVGDFNGAFLMFANGSHQYIENGEVLSAAHGGDLPLRKVHFLEAFERCKQMNGAIRFFEVSGDVDSFRFLSTVDTAIEQGVIEPPQDDYWQKAEQAVDEASSISAYICRNTAALIDSDAGKVSKFKYVLQKAVDSAPTRASLIGLSAGALMYAADGNSLTTGVGVGLMAINAVPAVLSLTYEGLAPLKLKASQALYEKLPHYRARVDKAIDKAAREALDKYQEEHGSVPGINEFPMSGKIEIGELLQISNPDANAALLKDVLQSKITERELDPITRRRYAPIQQGETFQRGLNIITAPEDGYIAFDPETFNASFMSKEEVDGLSAYVEAREKDPGAAAEDYTPAGMRR